MTTSHSGFNASTTAEEVTASFETSVKDKTILITGVSPRGLGEAMAKALAASQPRLLILAGRSEDKVNQVRREIQRQHPGIMTQSLVFDLLVFESIDRAVEQFLSSGDANIDILINNAGVMNIPDKRLSPEGYELHLATNFLGPFLLTKRLMPALVSQRGARIVNVASNSHMFQPFRFADYNFENGENLPDSELPNKQLCDTFELPYGLAYLPVMAYGQSKTAAILHVAALNHQYGTKGITAIACHPGAIDTYLWRYMPTEAVQATQKMLPMRSLSAGASTPLVAALDPALTGVKVPYLEDCQQGTPEQVMPFAYDAVFASKLLELGETLTGYQRPSKKVI